MMKPYLFPLCLFLSTLTYGQITVTNVNLPEAGTIILGYQINDNLPSPGNNGTNQSWDFSSIVADPIDNISYTSPQSTPYYDAFPNANLAFTFSETYYYEENDGQNWLLHGIVQSAFNPGDGQFTYAPPHFNAKFPINYNDTYQHQYSKLLHQKGNGTFDSIIGNYDVMIASSIDGWGTLETPLGVYQALREHRHEVDTITLTTYLNGVSSSNTSVIEIESYYWWSEEVNVKFPVAVHSITDNGNGSTYFTYYDVDSMPTSSRNQVEKPEIKVYPNPTNGILYLDKNINNLESVVVYDILGNEVTRVNIANRNIISLKGLPIGVYSLVFLDRKGISVRKSIIVK